MTFKSIKKISLSHFIYCSKYVLVCCIKIAIHGSHNFSYSQVVSVRSGHCIQNGNRKSESK